jgi:diadenylate cyclase
VSTFFDDIRIFLGNVGWRDVLDVIIVALILYQLLKLVRGTQAAQLLVGLVVLLVVDLFATALDLRLLKYVFANGGQAILIAAVVLFQPELRRALDQVGRLAPVRAFLPHQAGGGIPRLADEVIRAAGSLSERRTGALIVFATGVRINGETTAEMLATLFFPNSPLHDGAVIIRDERIVAAGCVLPLADAIPGVGRMGTRHRAALGLTLQSDALVLIVSEETGLISVAHQGKVYRGLDQEKLRDMLVTLLGGEPGHGRVPIPRPFLRSSGVRATRR